MVKKGAKKQALGLTASALDEADLKNVKKEGFLSASAEIVFPIDEVIHAPPSGFQVIFLAFLLRGFSLPAHEFLCGLLFVYGVQLHQLMPNSLLHIACFITLCEAFLGIDPHWILWKYLFCLRPSGSKGEILELGSAIISLRSESQYLDFKMTQLVQSWIQKCFYIKDQKYAEFDKYGLAPFDASKSLTKLTTWDALPSDAEVKSTKPLLTRIQELKNAAEKELTGTQLMVFFLQRRIQPLQARVSKLWTYSGSNDPSRVSPKDLEKKYLDKRVRSLTTLTAKLAVPAYLAVAFDSTHPLPKVIDS
jgi:hypothetical protein